MSTIVQFLEELDSLLEDNMRLRERVKELEAQRFNNRPKLGKGEVARIHEMRRAGYTVSEIADSFDLNKSTVSRTLRGEYHK